MILFTLGIVGGIMLIFIGLEILTIMNSKSKHKSLYDFLEGNNETSISILIDESRFKEIMKDIKGAEFINDNTLKYKLNEFIIDINSKVVLTITQRTGLYFTLITLSRIYETHMIRDNEDESI